MWHVLTWHVFSWLWMIRDSWGLPEICTISRVQMLVFNTYKCLRRPPVYIAWESHSHAIWCMHLDAWVRWRVQIVIWNVASDSPSWNKNERGCGKGSHRVLATDACVVSHGGTLIEKVTRLITHVSWICGVGFFLHVTGSSDAIFRVTNACMLIEPRGMTIGMACAIAEQWFLTGFKLFLAVVRYAPALAS